MASQRAGVRDYETWVCGVQIGVSHIVSHGDLGDSTISWPLPAKQEAFTEVEICDKIGITSKWKFSINKVHPDEGSETIQIKKTLMAVTSPGVDFHGPTCSVGELDVVTIYGKGCRWKAQTFNEMCRRSDERRAFYTRIGLDCLKIGESTTGIMVKQEHKECPEKIGFELKLSIVSLKEYRPANVQE